MYNERRKITKQKHISKENCEQRDLEIKSVEGGLG